MTPHIRHERISRRHRRVPAALVAATCAVVAAVVLAVGSGAGVGAAPGQATGSTTTTAPAAGALPTITANSVVVVEQEPGQVSVIEGGKPRPIAGGLSKPNGVAILPDGGIVVADSGNNRLVGIGGRFGGSLKEIVQVPFPEGVGVGADGSVYVTLLLAGEVGRVDLDAGTYTKIAGDLKGPGDVAERGGNLVVTESTGGDVVEVTPAGATSVVATGFQQPIGLVAGAGRTLYVADFKANKVVKVDDAGKSSDFAKLDAPVQLASAPFVLTTDIPTFALTVTAKEGLVVFDNTAKRVSTIAIPQATGVATGAVGSTPPPSSTTTTTAAPPTSVTGTSAVTPTTRAAGGTSTPSTPRTTRPRATTTLPPLDDAPASSTGSILVFSLAVIALAAVALLTVFFVRRPKTMQKSGFEERPLDADSVADAFGPCAAEEVEVAEAEGARDAVIVQREATEKRQRDAERRVTATRSRLAEATAQRERIEAERRDAQENGPPSPEDLGSTEIKPDELGLTTEGGREALSAFAAGELDAHELEERWHELGEQQAIDVVREVGERRARLDPSKPWPDELRAIDTEAKVTAELEEAERDVEFAEAEIQRLNEREAEVLERIRTAHEALEACQARHRDAQRAKAAKARAAAEADAAEADAAAPAPPSGGGAGDAPAGAAAPGGSGADSGTGSGGGSGAGEGGGERPAGASAAEPGAGEDASGAGHAASAGSLPGGDEAGGDEAGGAGSGPEPARDQTPAGTTASAAAAGATPPSLGTREEMLALIEEAKRSRREAAARRARGDAPPEAKPATDAAPPDDAPAASHPDAPADDEG